MIRLNSKRKIIPLAVFYTFLWGCAFPLVKLCMDSFGAVQNVDKCLLAGVRFIFSGILVISFCFFKEGKRALIGRNELPYALSYGTLGTALQYAFTYIGLSSIDGAKGAIFDQLAVFIIIVLGGIFIKTDKLTLLKVFGCIAGFIGVLAVSTEKMSFTFSLGGEGMMLLASACQAGAYFVALAGKDKLSCVKLVGYGQFFGGLVLTASSLALGGVLGALNPLGILYLAMLSLISAVAYVLSLIPLKYFPASEISVFNLLITVFGVVMSSLALGENILKINYLISGILITVGIIAVNYTKKNKGKENFPDKN